MDILICAKITKIIATRTSSGLKIWQQCFGGRGPRWESLQRSPRPLAGFWEGKMGKKGGKEMSERSERGGGTKRRGRRGERRRRGPYWSALPQPLNPSNATGRLNSQTIAASCPRAVSWRSNLHGATNTRQLRQKSYYNGRWTSLVELLISGPAAQSRHHLRTVQTTAGMTTTRSVTAPVRRRYSNIRLLSAIRRRLSCTRYQWVRGRCWWVDVEQSAST